jgi:mono/diheme cytochrome c family protein
MVRSLSRFALGALTRFALGALAAGALLAAPAALAAGAAAGKAKYDMFCASCHGPAGKGDGPVGATLNPKPRDFSVGDFKFDTDGDGKRGTDADLKNVVKNGGGAYGGSAMMAPWGATLSAADLDNVVAFVRSLKK